MTMTDLLITLRHILTPLIDLLNYKPFVDSDVLLWHLLVSLFAFGFVCSFIAAGNGFRGGFLPLSGITNRGRERASDNVDNTLNSAEWVEHSDSQFYYDS